MCLRIRHPNCVSFYGVVYNQRETYIVTEFMPNGSLRDFLHATTEKGQVLPEKMALGFARDVAAGMLYLSSLGIVHRDLASRNILLKEDVEDDKRRKLVAKVSDFGLSRAVTPQHNYYRSASGLMPAQWSAPEALRYKRFSTKTDVWSYGILLWEIFSGGAEPYNGLTGAELRSYVEEGGRLAKPDACSDRIYAFMRRCWAANSSDRPSFKEVYDFVDSEYNATPDITDEDLAAALEGFHPESQHLQGKGTRGHQEENTNTNTTAAANNTKGGGGGALPVLSLGFANAETTLQELYDQSMGRSDPASSLNFAIALFQLGDLPNAYSVVSELLHNATPDPTEKLWASAFFVRGSFNIRFGDFYAAAQDFSQASTFMKALGIQATAIPRVKTVPEGRFWGLFPAAVSISDVGCAAGNAFFYHAITGPMPDEERIRIFAVTESTFTRALDQPNPQRGNIFFNLGQIYYCHSVYVHDAAAQNALLLQALSCYSAALPLVPPALQVDTHIMRAKALARLGRHAEANTAIEASIKIDPRQSIPNLKSSRELMAQPEVPAGIVCGSKSEHDFQEFHTFSIATLCCNYCGRIQLFQRTLYRCTRCSYTVHAQCLPCLKFQYCFDTNTCSSNSTNSCSNTNSWRGRGDSTDDNRNGGSKSEELKELKEPLTVPEAIHSSRSCSKHSDLYPDTNIGRGRSSSVCISEKTANTPSAANSVSEEKARNSRICPSVTRERYVVTHVHSLRPGIPYFECCAMCSKAFHIGDVCVRCVACRKIFHTECVNKIKAYVMLHPAEFPSLNSSAIQMCGLNNVLFWPKEHTQ